MRYGLPYKGSKNAIAKWIIGNLPKADTFVDLFFGGGAVTHVALLSGKYERFVINDIDGRLPKLFLECVYGKHTVDNHSEWVSRTEFHAKKESDAYIALIWSFGNNGIDYIYGADIEDMKHAYHKAVYFDDLDALKPYGYNLTRSHEKTVYGRYLEYQRQIKRQTQGAMLEVVSRQVEVERLQSLQSLQSYGTDYRNVPIPDGALIYCDIPYIGTNCGKYDGFNHTEFYEWAEQQDNIFISEYSMPEPFIVVSERKKTILSSASGNSDKATEKIYTNPKTVKNHDVLKQTTIFDFMEVNHE